MIRQFTSLYRPHYASVLVYMLQNTEYQPGPYLKWVWRTTDFDSVMRRRSLELTGPARLLRWALRLGIAAELIAGLSLIYLGGWHNLAGGVPFGLALIIIYPFVWPYLIVLPLILGRELRAKPKERRLVTGSAKVFAEHPGVRLAVAGSYGKTTMKEILKTVLSEGLKVAATPANKNVSVSHAHFAAKLKGDEAVLIIEYGEGAPGDVARFARITKPTHAVITGLAPAHLDRYKTLQAAGQDIFSVADHLDGRHVYVNGNSQAIKPFLKPTYQVFNDKGALGWQVSDVRVGLDGTKFNLTKGRQTIKLTSGLVGRHQVGYLALAAALALELGLSRQQVIDGLARTKPFEHRMQPYRLAGAWIVDDTYNGNLEGIRAGTQLLKELKADRKIYVTPGLVDQGEETETVHHAVGRLIAEAKPDLVVLMKNSVTGFIEAGLKAGKFAGELRIEADPLEFYTNLQHFVADGDLVVMQNDWTDNYA